MIYRFSSCVLNSQHRELTVDGAPVHVEPQVFDVLLYLVERRDCVVSRDELIDAVWHGRIVSEATVAARIWGARHAIGDTGEAQGMIRTLPRRGFRFVAPVIVDDPGSEDAARLLQESRLAVVGEDLADEPSELPVGRAERAKHLVRQPGRTASAGSLRRFAIATAGIMLLIVGAGVATWGQLGQARLETATVERLAFPLPDKPSIAVLPFANLSGAAAREFMGEGLTESLVNALARNPQLFVISHSSTDRYADQPIAPKQVAEELGVRYVVNGSIKRTGNRVRVMTQLVDAFRGSVLWSERYERPADDLFALDAEITARIARSLDIRIIYGSDQSPGGTRSLDAWAAYVQGRSEYLKFTKPGNLGAREHYQRALQFDPNYPEAMIALAYTELIEMGRMPAVGWESALAKIKELERRAAKIAPRMPQLLELRSLLALTQGDLALALSEAEAMVALDPNGAESHYALGRMYFFTGQYERAIESLSTAVRINPHSSATYSSHLAFSQLALGRTDAAISLLEAVTERSPDYSPAHAYLAIAYQLAGREPEARLQAARLPHVAPDITMLVVNRRFSPLQDRSFANRIIKAARQAGIPG
jgi:adenylate cyclase